MRSDGGCITSRPHEPLSAGLPAKEPQSIEEQCIASLREWKCGGRQFDHPRFHDRDEPEDPVEGQSTWGDRTVEANSAAELMYPVLVDELEYS